MAAESSPNGSGYRRYCAGVVFEGLECEEGDADSVAQSFPVRYGSESGLELGAVCEGARRRHNVSFGGLRSSGRASGSSRDSGSQSGAGSFDQSDSVAAGPLPPDLHVAEGLRDVAEGHCAGIGYFAAHGECADIDWSKQVRRLCRALLRDRDFMSTGKENFRSFDEERINQEASDWVAKKDEGFSAEEQDAFFNWLAESPRHSDAYSRRQKVWTEMDVLADWRPEHSSVPNPDLLAVSRKRAKRIWIAAISGIAAALAIVFFVTSQGERSLENASVMLAAGESARFYEHHVLEDGSAVELNRGAQVTVRYTEDKRMIDLLSGEAHFTVAKDTTRPFVVRARGAVVQAVGTAFNVLLKSEEVEVIVTEGRVLMNPSIATTREGLIVETEPSVRSVRAGQRSVVAFRSGNLPPIVEEIPIDALERRLSWKSLVLDFTETPLADAILEFNRRNHTQLVIGDKALEEILVTGTLNPNNLDLFTEMLVVTEGVHIERDGVSKIILMEGK